MVQTPTTRITTTTTRAATNAVLMGEVEGGLASSVPLVVWEGVIVLLEEVLGTAGVVGEAVGGAMGGGVGVGVGHKDVAIKLAQNF